jgi:hypothetical protein
MARLCDRCNYVRHSIIPPNCKVKRLRHDCAVIRWARKNAGSKGVLRTINACEILAGFAAAIYVIMLLRASVSPRVKGGICGY